MSLELRSGVRGSGCVASWGGGSRVGEAASARAQSREGGELGW